MTLALLAVAATVAATSTGPEAAARAHLLAHQARYALDAGEIASMAVARRYTTPGLDLTTLWLQQTLGGLPVEGATVRFAVDCEGAIVWARADALVPGLRAEGERVVPAAEALRRGARAAGLQLGGDPVPGAAAPGPGLRFTAPNLWQPALVEPVVLPTGRPGWRMVVDQREPSDLRALLVDATSGRLLFERSLVFHLVDGLVFNGPYPSSVPGGVTQTIESFGPTSESPDGWLFAAGHPLAPYSTGNNADAKEDWLADNETTVGVRANGGASQEFRFPFQDSWEQASDYASDRDAAITNAFYWANRFHDFAYRLGFDEAAGNFQLSNFGKGGLEGDPVYVDVQEGAAPASGSPRRNNATMAVPVDGMKPRLQLLLWDLFARRDSAFDGDVLVHELSHGLIYRLVGGPSVTCLGGPTAGAIVEGIADFMAADTFASPVMGEYVSDDLMVGLRNYPVNQNPRTYCDRCDLGCQSHRDGEIVASTLWELRGRIGSSTLLPLLVDALKLMPCDPMFLDLRDALVAADQNRNGGVNVCAIWDTFSARGMGYDATAGACDFIPAPQCSGEAYLRSVASRLQDQDGDGLVRAGETVDLDIQLTNDLGRRTATAVFVTLSTSTPGVTLLTPQSSYADLRVAASGWNQVPFRFRAEPGYVCGVPLVFEVAIAWSAPARTRRETLQLSGTFVEAVSLLLDDAEGAPGGWTPTAPANLSAAENHTPGGGWSYWMSAGCWAGNSRNCGTSEPCDETCAYLSSPPLRLPSRTRTDLAFWSRYNLEADFDALFLEVSTNGGLSWSTAPLQPGTIIASVLLGCGMTGDATGVTGPSGNTGLTPWTEVRADLSRWAGQEVLARLVQHNDTCTYFEGAWVDDLGVVSYQCQTAPHVLLHAYMPRLRDDAGSCSDRDGFLDPDEQGSLEVEVANLGNATATAAQATLRTTSPKLFGLPVTRPLGDLAPGATATASLGFSVAPIASVACFEDASLDLELSSALPSTDNLGLKAVLRGDAPLLTWRDDMEGGQPPWTASLGPDGSDQDFALRQVDCFNQGSFWSTNLAMTPPVCGSGEPDFRPDSDSVLTSPPIDLGGAGARLVSLRWRAAPDVFAQNWGTSASPGFVEVSLDHDGDSSFTPIASWTGGRNPANRAHLLDIQKNEPGNPLLARDAVRQVRARYRFRALGPDPSPGRDADGMLVDDVLLSWQSCPQTGCAPCVPASLAAVTRLHAVKKLPGGVRLSWDALPGAREYHLTAVTEAGSIPGAHRPPRGSGEDRCPGTPSLSCEDGTALGDSRDLYYQLIGACGPTASEEGAL